MNRYLIVLFMGMFVLFFLTCQNKQEHHKKPGTIGSDQTSPENIKVKNIIIYGSKTCIHCVSFLDRLDQDSISYTFKNVDTNDANFQEMYAKIKQIKFKGYVNYPVVDVGGEILVAPDLDEFYKVYR